MSFSDFILPLVVLIMPAHPMLILSVPFILQRGGVCQGLKLCLVKCTFNDHCSFCMKNKTCKFERGKLSNFKIWAHILAFIWFNYYMLPNANAKKMARKIVFSRALVSFSSDGEPDIRVRTSLKFGNRGIYSHAIWSSACSFDEILYFS